MPFSLKQPAFYDFYHMEYPIKWERMIGNAKPVAVAFKATDWKVWVNGKLIREYIDPRVFQYVHEVKEQGYPYLLYHFFKEDNIYEQAVHYMSTITALGGWNGQRPVLDFEIIPKMKNRGKEIAYQVKTWLDYVEKFSGKKPIIYSSQYYLSYLLDRGNPPSWLNDYPLWDAWYPYSWAVDRNNDIPRNRMPKGYLRWAIWQYNDKGRTNGYPANDLNVVADWFLPEITETV